LRALGAPLARGGPAPQRVSGGTRLAAPVRVSLRARILVVDADRDAASSLHTALADLGFDVADAPGVDAAARVVVASAPDVVVARVEGAEDGAAIAGALRAAGSDASLVAVVRGGALDAAVAALRAGAESFLVAPVGAAHAAVVLEKVLETRRLRRERAALREEARRRHAIVGDDPAMRLVDEVVRRAAPTKATVLVEGESGTGRHLVAQALHEASPRRDGPFVRARCAARSQALLEGELFGHAGAPFDGVLDLSPGLVESAHGGTLFVDDVAALSRPLQVRLLRVLQHGELERGGSREAVRVDVRVVAASTRDLADEVRAGRLQDDLYYRLNVVTVALPPLRGRRGDLPLLANHFLARSARADGRGGLALSPGALSALFAYEWPGNVRELAAAMGKAVARCDGRVLGEEHLSAALRGARPDRGGASGLIPGATLFEIERDAILRTLDDVGGSTARAAEILGVSVRKVQYKLKEYRSGLAAPRRVA
jgi:two-component system, NtrC family, response regulator HydG